MCIRDSYNVALLYGWFQFYMEHERSYSTMRMRRGLASLTKDPYAGPTHT